VPLVEMFGYKATLGSLSRGRASFMLSFSRYVPVHPPDLPPAMRA
jgi:translation elongation factor EF-G